MFEQIVSSVSARVKLCVLSDFYHLMVWYILLHTSLGTTILTFIFRYPSEAAMLPTMMILAPLLLALHLASAAPTPDSNCRLRQPNITESAIRAVQKCNDFPLIDTKAANPEEISRRYLSLDEHKVATMGHVEGLKPESYSLYFRFGNKTHYEASANITVLVKEKTNKVVLNRHLKAPDIEYDKILITPLCEEEKSEPVCIEQMWILNDSFVLVLTKPLLVSDINAHMSIPDAKIGASGMHVLLAGQEVSDHRPKFSQQSL